jgi:hypothetical protein
VEVEVQVVAMTGLFVVAVLSDSFRILRLKHTLPIATPPLLALPASPIADNLRVL